MPAIKISFLISILLWFVACTPTEVPDNKGGTPEPTPDPEEVFLQGADLSYVNEMLDCGAVYKNAQGDEVNPYQLFADAGTDLVRIRLWHNPTWTAYSNYEDVKKSIQESKSRDLKVLLDFHYSDDWADPQKQYIPAAWEGVIDDTQVLGRLLVQLYLQDPQRLGGHRFTSGHGAGRK